MSGSGKSLLGVWLYRRGESWAVKEGSPLHKSRDVCCRIFNQKKIDSVISIKITNITINNIAYKNNLFKNYLHFLISKYMVFKCLKYSLIFDKLYV